MQKVDITVSGAWSRYRKARPSKPHAWAVGSRFSPTHDKNLAIGVAQPRLIISAEPHQC